MKQSLLTAPSPLLPLQIPIFPNCKALSLHYPSNFRSSPSLSSPPPSISSSFLTFTVRPSRFRRRNCVFKSSRTDSDAKTEPRVSNYVNDSSETAAEFSNEVRSPAVPSNLLSPRLSLSDQAFFLLAFIGCTTSAAFVGLVAASVPTLFAMGKAAIALAKLADTAREELPSTMAAIRLSGMEISDLTLELSDLSQEIADGVNKSAQAAQAAEAGIRQIGSLARERTISMIEKRPNLTDISLQPLVAGAAKKTSRAVGRATRSLMSIISRGEGSSSENEDGNAPDRLDV